MKYVSEYKPLLNSVTKRLPKHLHKFIVKQPYEEYTAQNQAVWRYVMRLNIDYLKNTASGYYLEGLLKTGISIDIIPKMEGMNRILKEIGWAAVAVDGFIPPNAFMEFQAYNVLVIASDIRTLEHIAYTPAPDIIHEAAGHAPIIANPEYAEYLRRFGEIGCKAISSAEDYELYDAVRHLSIVKEDPNTPLNVIKEAVEKVNKLQSGQGELSEMAQIRNLHWWTVEYGLIGTIENPKIYGAGLLSSIGESKACLSDDVIKIPYTIEAAKVNFDITKPQPQLFVTPNFSHLSYVLEKFANKMAIRKGGLQGVKKLITSKSLGTVELSTGIQISGVFTNVISYEGKVIYIQTIGNTALASREKELIGHGITYHKEGFGSPVGKLEGINLAIEDMSPKDLEVYGIYEGLITELVFEGGVKVVGKIITGKRDLQGKILLISFENCTVTYKNQTLFRPEWGIYDMAVGKEVTSAFSGPASLDSFDNIFKVSKEKTHKITYSENERILHSFYGEVREMREKKKVDEIRLKEIFNEVLKNNSQEWLLFLEIYELVSHINYHFSEDVLNVLNTLRSENKYTKLIEDGLRILANNKK
ncbi:phenylalanine-4-hydroxylase [Lutibacter oceani]|uniref:Phenylalanine-4-hydroxylase n=1 Tax=Lutibacter oceani TaxID=1853311 RepID=A0A3D9RT73_9FLAO|nr:aromatic amino acid hydroxylase [Lutibacter oceani]REE83150.1 phenylalanine-4-hydroxylase [Lutibacter oceani]